MEPLAQIGNFRLQTVTKFNPENFDHRNPANAFEAQPISYGLAIEVKVGQSDSGEGNYIVIAFLRPNDHDQVVDLHSSGKRLIRYIETMADLQIVNWLYDYGRNRIAEARDWE